MKIVIFDDKDYFYDNRFPAYGRLLKKGLNTIESPHVMFCVGVSSNEFNIVYDSALKREGAQDIVKKNIDELIDTGDIVFLDLLWSSAKVATCREIIIEKVKSMDAKLFIYTTRGGEEALSLDRSLEQEMGEKYLGYTVMRLEKFGDDFSEAIKILSK